MPALAPNVTWRPLYLLEVSESIAGQMLSYSNPTMLALGYFPATWPVICHLGFSLAPPSSSQSVSIENPWAPPETLSSSLGMETLPLPPLPSYRLFGLLF